MIVGVVTFRILPKGREFWLEVSGDDGSRRFIQRFEDEDAAVQQMRRLQQRADRREERQATKPAAPCGPEARD